MAAKPSTASTAPKYYELIESHGSSGWQKCYESELVPWDKGEVAPALAQLLQNGMLPNGLTVVPGCGYGYDVVALASGDRRVIGIDIAPLAVERAKKIVEKFPNAEIRVADFFSLELDGEVDLIYDYTFLCALPVELRTQWAEKMAKLLKPGAILATLMFPLQLLEPDSAPPPHPVPLETYKQLLLSNSSFELVHLDLSVPSFPTRAGREAMALWKRI
jgi:SAM-dependent methyltransferase